MKKKISSLIFALLFIIPVCLVFTGCFGTGGKGHQHTYATEYTYDKTHHWFEKTCGCELEEKDKQEHSFVNDKCRYCKYFRYEGMLEFEKLRDYSSGYYYSVKGPYRAYGMKNVIIPDTYEGLPVRRVDASAFDNASVETITFGANIETIGVGAFADNPNLKSVTFNEKCTFIGASAFSGCTSLETVNLSSTMATINKGAFEDCTSLTEITLPASVYTVYEQVFKGCSNLKTVNILGTQTRLFGSFDGCDGIESIALPDGCTEITAEAFQGASNLEEITIPASVTRIASDAFFNTKEGLKVKFEGTLADFAKIDFSNEYSSPLNCGYLEIDGQVITELDDSVTEITNYAFYNYDRLTSINAAVNLTSIGVRAFEGCEGLTSIITSEKLVSIGDYAFYNASNVEEITISASVATVGQSAFEGLPKLAAYNVDEGNQSFSSIEGNLYSKDKTEFIQYAIGKTAKQFVMPSSVTTVRKFALAGEVDLEEITLPFVGQSLTGTENTHFGYIYGASSYEEHSTIVPSNLKVITINGASSLASNCLYGLASLTAINLQNIVGVGEGCFYGCVNIKNIVIPTSVEVTNLNPYVLEGLDNLEEVTFSCLRDYGYYLPEKVTKVTILRGEEYYKACFEDSKQLEHIVLPADLKEIESYSFENFENLKNLDIPDGVTYIGLGVFKNCTSLTELVLPKGVTSIYAYVFEGCSGLTSLNVKGSITSIGVRAFYGCYDLENLVFDNLNYLTTIRSLAFFGCPMSELHLTESVTKIESLALPTSLDKLTLPFLGETISQPATKDVLENFVPYFVNELTILGGEITSNAFTEGFPYIKKLTLGENVSQIGLKAFNGITNLEEVNFKNFKNISIGSDVFLGCDKINKVNIESVENWLNLHFGSFYSNPTYYSKNLYLQGELLTDVVVPESVVEFKPYAFINCETITSITLSDNFVGNDGSAIQGCVNLEFNQYGNLYYMGSQNNDYLAVVRPTALDHDNITLHKGTKLIMTMAFNNIQTYSYVDISDLETWFNLNLEGCLSYGNTPFKATTKMYLKGVEITEINIPESVETIYEGFLTNVTTIQKVVLSEGVKYINSNAFNGASGLTELHLPATIETINTNAFANTVNIEKVYIASQNDWLEIGFADRYANPFGASRNASFYLGDSVLLEFTVPEGVQTIKQYAFTDVNNLDKINIPNSVNTYEKYAFYGCMFDVNIQSADNWVMSTFANIESNPIYNSGKLYVNNVELVDLVLTTATEIKKYAFYSYQNIQTVVGGTNLTKVGAYAFYENDGLISVDISSVKTLDTYAFAGCSNMTTLLAGQANEIYAYALYNCSKLANDDNSTVVLYHTDRVSEGYWQSKRSKTGLNLKSYKGIWDKTGKFFIKVMSVDNEAEEGYAFAYWIWVED